ncbi:MAG: alpha-1,2-fucosyltransferase [Endomicrobium sp.]|jgi:hypothetical protein|nr:alpha-1,2-fucosyltransferase [Endomicrobium sp.]
MKNFLMQNKFSIILIIFLIVFVGIMKWRECSSSINKLVKDPCVIMTIEHGLVDQLEFFVVGQQIKKLGYKVKYDISWYKNVGHASDPKKSVDSRSLQLLKAFPYIEFDMASDEEIKLYKENFAFCVDSKHQKRSWRFGKKIKPPIYISVENIDWWNLCQDVSADILRFGSEDTALNNCSKYFHFEDSIMGGVNTKILERIRKAKHSIGVHVRRGDDARHGAATSLDYFLKAVKKAKELFPNSYFFFFSDEPEYVKDNIFTKLGSDIRKEIINVNDVDSCYKDLFLMSECKHQIRSQGSMGAIAYLLNKYSGKKLIAPARVRMYSNIKPDIVID